MSDPAPTKHRDPNLDSVTTINADGSRYFLHPADVRGRWTLLRRVVGYILLVLFFALPWVRIDGFPSVFLDIANRQFHVFGLTLPPQDLWILFFLITGLGFTLFFVTSLFGRVWCGWTCPYTVFIDHIYRRIERVIEGDAQARRKLDAEPWNPGKLARRVVKHALFFLVSTAIAHTFVAYFVSLHRMYEFMHGSPHEHITAFGVVVFLTVVLWFCFGYFREQFCIIMCPYGRIQSALTDDDTVIIGYDEIRGEPRGHVRKNKGGDSPEKAGDCIDCRRCVQVCPTGIDIRNGLQLECIGCSACIDACNAIMDKVGRPRGLVRYDSMNALAGKERRFLRPRIIGYTVLGILGMVVFGFVASQKLSPFSATVSRMNIAGAPPFFVDDAAVRNIYQLRLINKRNKPVHFTIRLGENTPPGFQLAGESQVFDVGPLGELKRSCVVLVERKDYTGAIDLELVVTAEPGGATQTKKVRFLGPDPGLVE